MTAPQRIPELKRFAEQRLLKDRDVAVAWEKYRPVPREDDAKEWDELMRVAIVALKKMPAQELLRLMGLVKRPLMNYLGWNLSDCQPEEDQSNAAEVFYNRVANVLLWHVDTK